MLAIIDRAYEWLLRAMVAVAGVCVALMMVAIVYITMFRWMDLSYWAYAFEAVEYGFVYVMMLGSPWLVRKRGHVYIEIVTAALPAATRRVVSRFVALLCMLACIVLARYSFDLFWDDWSTNHLDEKRSRDLERWLGTVVLPLGFGLMAVEFLRFVVARETMHTGQAGLHE
jgi:TRAP-type C4-dicarboxylate transport system permease small subunit